MFRFEKYYNKARGEWWIYSCGPAGSTLAKVCKTERAADKWIAAHS